MAYVNPGAAASSAIESWMLDRDTRARQEKLDALKMQQAELELQAKQQEMRNAEQDRERKAVIDLQSGLVPGDVPDAELLSRSQRVGLPLPIKVTPTEVVPGPTEDGAPLTEGGQSIYLGTPQYRMQQKAVEDARALAEQKSAGMAAAAGAENPEAVLQGVLKAGGSPAEAKSIMDALQNGQPVYRASADKRSIEEFKGGQWVPATNIQEKGHWLQEVQPTNIHVTTPGPTDGSNIPEWKIQMFLRTGQYPAFGADRGGMLRQNFDAAVTNYTAGQGGKPALSGDAMAAQGAQFAADKKSLADIQPKYDAVTAFAKTADMNVPQLTAVLDKIPDWGNMSLNQLHRAGTKWLGNEDMAQFNAAMKSLTDEYARLVRQPNLSGVLTDSAADDMATTLDKAYTKGQMLRALQVLQAEGHNRAESYRQQMAEIRERMTPEKPKTPNNETPEQRRKRLLGS